MNRNMKLMCFYFGIFYTLFFSTYTISIYKPQHIIDEIIKLTDELIKEIPPENDAFLDTPMEHHWKDHKQCVRMYLHTFEHEMGKVSTNNTTLPIIERIRHCTKILKQRCQKIMREAIHVEICEEEIRERGAGIFMHKFRNFSRFLDHFCNDAEHDKDYSYVTMKKNVC